MESHEEKLKPTRMDWTPHLSVATSSLGEIGGPQENFRTAQPPGLYVGKLKDGIGQ